jgi:hypothetical protein
MNNLNPWEPQTKTNLETNPKEKWVRKLWQSHISKKQEQTKNIG